MAKDTKGKSGVPAVEGEKQSPTDIQEIQMQMNATTDEVRVLLQLSISIVRWRARTRIYNANDFTLSTVLLLDINCIKCCLVVHGRTGLT